MNRGDNDQPWEGDPGERRLVQAPGPLALRGQGNPLRLFQPDQPGGDDDGAGFNFLQYWYLLVRHRRLIAGALAAGVVLGLLATLLTTPVYRATTTMQIDREAVKVVDIEGIEPASTTGDRDYYQTQYALLQSRSLAERVVDRLNLADDAGFMASQSRSPLSLVKRLMGRDGTSATDAAGRAARERSAANKLLANLSVEPIRGSRLVHVSYSSPDPQMAARVSNAVADNFIGANLDRRFQSSAYARRFLEERIAQVKTKLEESERDLVAYATEQQLVSVAPSVEGSDASDTVSTSLTAANLVAMNSELAMAKAERIRAEQRWRQAAGTNSIAMAEVMQSPTIQTLRASRAQLQTEYQEKLSVYKPEFPAMVQLRAQIEEIDRQIAAEAKTVKDSLRAQYEVALRQEQSLQGQVSGLTSGVLDQRGRSIQYNILQREVDTNRTLYDGLLQRYKEIGVAGGLAANNIAIVDRAQIPRSPYKPNLMLNILIGAGIALLVGLGAALILETLDETIKMPEDVEGKLGVPLLGSIPVLDRGVTPAEALADSRSAFSEAYYSVRTALQFSTDTGVPPNLLITSARPSEGKSTTAMALARNFAKLGMKVLLVDGDLRNPSLHRAMGCGNERGLSNFLTGQAAIADVAQASDEPNLAFVPSGPLPPNPAELLAGARIRRLMEEAGQHFDLMIIDGPPVMGLADAPLLASVAAGTVVVVEAGSTGQGLVKSALRRLGAGGARVLGAVLTKFSVKTAGYGYGYGYSYSYSYDYGSKLIEAK